MTAIALEGLLVRPPTRDDAEKVVDLFNTCSIAETGEPATTTEELLREWTLPELNLATDIFLIMDGDKVVGYQEYWNIRPPWVNIFAFGRVHPDYEKRGIGTAMLHMVENRARQDFDKAPPDARIFLSTGINHVNDRAKALLENEGYSLIRHFWRMKIDMDQPPAAPVWPEGITVRTHIPGQDDRAVHAALDEAFEDHWGHTPFPFEHFETFMLKDPKFDPTLWFLAMDGDQIAGLSLCRWEMPEDPQMAWVDDLGVRRPWRRRGVARALLLHSFNEFYRRGKRRAGLGVDSQSLTGATRLYEGAGMHPDRQWDRFEKTLRDGVELTTRTLEE